MNEFLEQFAIESRELVTLASDGLLKLEKSPQDTECLDAVFRAFHTLKGGAGIVEFAAMEHAVHAAEDMLSEARSGRRDITTMLVEDCLASLDQITAWLDTIATTGALPEAAQDQAEAIVRRFSAASGSASPVVPAADEDDGWMEALLARHELAGSALTALRYVPSPDCFFQDEDPVARIESLPLLQVMELAPVSPWPALSELDPNTCNLRLMAITASTLDAVRAHMRGHSGECQMLAISAAVASSHDAGLYPPRVQALLHSQIALLSEAGAEQRRGRIASAGAVAANALLSLGREAQSRSVRLATEAAVSSGDQPALARALQALLSTEAAAPQGSLENTQAAQAASTLRVDTTRIDALVRLAGELTTAKNALGHVTARAQEDGLTLAAALKDRLSDFERLIERLQRDVLALRVLPLRTVLQRFPRVLREISSALGKPVALHITGDHTEADKTIVEMLFEPLLHTLRNAVDHGIEESALRMERGKPLVASVEIRASREGDRVIIEVEDDGAGIDVERVRRVALDRRLVTDAMAQTMTEAQIIDLIFAPGFSTAAAVTELSGRGVGLDAVRTAMTRVGGNVSITSRSGQGTRARFSLPFSVMVTQVMTVEAGGQTLGIPLEALIETVMVSPLSVSGVGSGHVFVHRERTIPLVDLARELGTASEPNVQQGPVTVAVACVAGQAIGLRIDRVGERMEVILKPLEGLLAGLRGITGTTLLGDGRVLLVLDVTEILS